MIIQIYWLTFNEIVDMEPKILCNVEAINAL